MEISDRRPVLDRLSVRVARVSGSAPAQGRSSPASTRRACGRRRSDVPDSASAAGVRSRWTGAEGERARRPGTPEEIARIAGGPTRGCRRRPPDGQCSLGPRASSPADRDLSASPCCVTPFRRATSSDARRRRRRDDRRLVQGSSVTTAEHLVDRVTGSLVDAGTGRQRGGARGREPPRRDPHRHPAHPASNAKRVRELGTLRRWAEPRLVVRQVTGESQVQGALGGLLGIVLGVGGAALVAAFARSLEATVVQTAQQQGPGFVGAFGQEPWKRLVDRPAGPENGRRLRFGRSLYSRLLGRSACPSLVVPADARRVLDVPARSDLVAA